MQATIRTMKQEDLQQVSELLYQLHRLHTENRPDIYKEAKREELLEAAAQEFLSGGLCLSACLGKELAGYCIASLRKAEGMFNVNDSYLYIDEICVKEEYQGQGIGRALFYAVKERAQRQGCSRMDLNCWAFNEKALKFYESLGFQIQRYRMEQKIQTVGEER